MKKTWIAILFAISISAAGAPDPALDRARLKINIADLDELVSAKHSKIVVRGADGEIRKFPRKPLDLAPMVPKIARMLKVDEPTVRWALVERRAKLSDLILAKTLSDQSGKPVRGLLGKRTDWLRELNADSLETANSSMDELYVEVALYSLDRRLAKSK